MYISRFFVALYLLRWFVPTAFFLGLSDDLSFAPQSQSLSCAEGHRFLNARFVIPETANLPESGMPAGWNTHIKARYHTASAIPLPSNQSGRSFLNTLAGA